MRDKELEYEEHYKKENITCPFCNYEYDLGDGDNSLHFDWDDFQNCGQVDFDCLHPKDY